jgi:hypothetical protein
MRSADYIIDECTKGLGSEDLAKKIRLVHMLGQLDDRRSFPLLADFLQDEDVRPYSVLALAQLNDSRALFPLINLFNADGDPVVQQRILQFMYHTGDPRATEFLAKYSANPSASFHDIAKTALRACKDNSDFTYRYNGFGDNYTRSLGIEGQIMVTNAALTAARETLAENQRDVNFKKPQTYIVGEDKIMLVGGLINEHVEVARGKDVLAAGEVQFKETSPGYWQVDEINQRSNGYHPDPASFRWVKEFFETGSDVAFDNTEFDETFPPEGFNHPDFLSVFMFGAHYR